MKRIREITGKWAVVTGASGGIGYEFCRTLARRGANIALLSIDDEPLRKSAENIEREFGVKTVFLTIDLCRKTACQEIFDWLKLHGISPYILINNAGIFSFNYLTETSDRKIDAFVALHIAAVTALSVAFARYFEDKGEGFILNMSSMSCWMPMPGLAMYASTKAYIRVFSRALHYEMRDRGVRVMVACPGGIATDLFGLPDSLKHLALRIGAIARPEHFTEGAINRLLKGKAQYINGLVNRIAIVFIGIMPLRVRMLVKKLLLDKDIRKP